MDTSVLDIQPFSYRGEPIFARKDCGLGFKLEPVGSGRFSPRFE